MSLINHVAIIMDGNGRWANERHRPRVWGHVRGSRIVSDIVQCASDLNLQALTLYAFSTENWSRPKFEIETLFKLLQKFLLKEGKKILENGICFKVIGDTSKLNPEVKSIIANLEASSASNTGLMLNLAFSYGGRKEIVDAANAFMKDHPGEALSEEALESYLYRPESGDVDLMIRTAGDQRISNFMLWESSYAELFFTETKWPDFTSKEFKQILDTVSQRERRFGGLADGDKLPEELNLKAVSHGS